MTIEPHLTDNDVSRITGRARSTLQKDRVAGGGIPFVKIGRLVRYRPSDVENYLVSLRAYNSTSEVTVEGAAPAAGSPVGQPETA